MNRQALILAALIAAPVQAQEVCDQACYDRLQVTISDQQNVINALRAEINNAPPGAMAGGALREEIAQCQQDRVDLFAVIDALRAKLERPEETYLLEEWAKVRSDLLELRINVILQQSELIGALSRCFHGG